MLDFSTDFKIIYFIIYGVKPMHCQCKTPEELAKLFPDQLKELDTYLNSLPLGEDREANKAYLIQSLHKAQEIFNYLPICVQRHIGEKLNLHLSEISGVISFYSYFTNKPVGKYKVNICTGTACYVKGADKLVEEFRRHLKIGLGETTKDGKFTLTGLRCVGACSLAPVVIVNDRVYGNVETKMVTEIIAECK